MALTKVGKTAAAALLTTSAAISTGVEAGNEKTDKYTESEKITALTKSKTERLLMQCDFNSDGKINGRSDVKKGLSTKDNSKKEVICKRKVKKEYLSKKNAQLDSEITQLDKDNVQLDKDNVQLDKDNAKLRQRIEQLDKENSQLDKENLQGRERIRKLKEKLSKQIK